MEHRRISPQLLLAAILPLAGLALLACAFWPRPAPPCSVLAPFGSHEAGGRCEVDRSLNLAGFAGPLLPDNLTIHGDLDIYGQRLDRLPRGLVVEGELFFYKATYDLPADVVVGGGIGTQLGFGDRMLRCADIPKTARIAGAVRCE